MLVSPPINFLQLKLFCVDTSHHNRSHFLFSFKQWKKILRHFYDNFFVTKKISSVFQSNEKYFQRHQNYLIVSSGCRNNAVVVSTNCKLTFHYFAILKNIYQQENLTFLLLPKISTTGAHVHPALFFNF